MGDEPSASGTTALHNKSVRAGAAVVLMTMTTAAMATSSGVHTLSSIYCYEEHLDFRLNHEKLSCVSIKNDQISAIS